METCSLFFNPKGGSCRILQKVSVIYQIDRRHIPRKAIIKFSLSLCTILLKTEGGVKENSIHPTLALDEGKCQCHFRLMQGEFMLNAAQRTKRVFL
jgi:hypothetical protein